MLHALLKLLKNNIVCGLLIAARFAALVMALWCCGALYWSFGVRGWLFVLWVSAFALMVISSWFSRRAWAMLSVLELAILTAFCLITPERMFYRNRWTRECAVIPRVSSIGKNRIVIDNIRDFKYRTPEEFDIRYKRAEFDISQLVSMDIAQSHWDDMYEVSHTLLCFNFRDRTSLAVSFEPRVPENSRGGQFFPGIYKCYAQMLLLSTPSDILDLRTKYRGETLYRYRTTLTPAEVQKLFMLIICKVESLSEKMEFYNSISTNCTTAFAPMFREVKPDFPGDIRLILNGYLDRMLFEAKLLKHLEGESFGSLKARSYVRGLSSGIQSL